MALRTSEVPSTAAERGTAQSGPEPIGRHLLGTMFDNSRLLERTLSTGTTVRLRVEEFEPGRVMVHEARRRRSQGPWQRWPEVEGVHDARTLRLDECRRVEAS